MERVDPARVGTKIISLFDPGMPAGIRCFAVLAGDAAGLILTDDPAAPTWSVVREDGSGTVYFGGALDAPLVQRVITASRATGDVLVGLWDTDDLVALLPPSPDYDGRTLEFIDRVSGGELDDRVYDVPAVCELRRMDDDLFPRCADHRHYAAIFGSPQRALEKGVGLCLVRGDEILCESFAGPRARGMMEIATLTAAAHRGRGYATITCANLIRLIEERGCEPYWNCAQQNRASAALARRLGFRDGREYRLLAWFRSAEAAP